MKRWLIRLWRNYKAYNLKSDRRVRDFLTQCRINNLSDPEHPERKYMTRYYYLRYNGTLHLDMRRVIDDGLLEQYK